MLCDICNKNPATVHLTEIIDDQMTELHLCEGCAKEKSKVMEQQFGLADLLAGLSEMGGKPEAQKEIVKLKCPACGLTYNDFRKTGRLGCSTCYSAFKKYLSPLLRKIHGSGQHFGKAPGKAAVSAPKKKNTLEELKEKLQKAIQTEAFEEAAKIRDQIRTAEEKYNAA